MRTVVLADSPIALPAFESLLRARLVVGLCTSRRRLPGEGLRQWARKADVPILEVGADELADPLESWLRAAQPDALLVFGFPFRLPPGVLAVPRWGCYNVHGAKLPEYRGPHPVFWQIALQEPLGAVTIHLMDDRFDHGPVVLARPVPIAPEDTHGWHGARLANEAVAAVSQLLERLSARRGPVAAACQDETRAKVHRRPTPEDLVIRWGRQTGPAIRALVKAGNPWNHGAFTSLRGINLRLADVTLLPAQGPPGAAAGSVLSSDPEAGVVVGCGDGTSLRLDVVSMEEGILPGAALANLGLRAGERFLEP